MKEIFEQLTQRDFLMLLVGGGLVSGLLLVVNAVFDKIFEVYDAKKRNVRPFDGWGGGRL